MVCVRCVWSADACAVAELEQTSSKRPRTEGSESEPCISHKSKKKKSRRPVCSECISKKAVRCAECIPELCGDCLEDRAWAIFDEDPVRDWCACELDCLDDIQRETIRILSNVHKFDADLNGIQAVDALLQALGEEACVRIHGDSPGVEISLEIAGCDWTYEIEHGNFDIDTPYSLFIPFLDGFFTEDELQKLEKLGAIDERSASEKAINRIVSLRGGVDDEELAVLKKEIAALTQ